MSVRAAEPRVSTLRGALVRAAAAGFVAALPLVLGALMPANVASLPNMLTVPLVLICPPWELFWALMGQPNDTVAAMRIGALVLAINAAIYMPMGAVHTWTKTSSVLLRWSAMVCAYLLLMGLGHLFFVFKESLFR